MTSSVGPLDRLIGERGCQWGVLVRRCTKMGQTRSQELCHCYIRMLL